MTENETELAKLLWDAWAHERWMPESVVPREWGQLGGPLKAAWIAVARASNSFHAQAVAAAYDKADSLLRTSAAEALAERQRADAAEQRGAQAVQEAWEAAAKIVESARKLDTTNTSTRVLWMNEAVDEILQHFRARGPQGEG